MATVVYLDGTESFEWNLYDLATRDWQYIDHVVLEPTGKRRVAHNPQELWRRVKELAGVVQEV